LGGTYAQISILEFLKTRTNILPINLAKKSTIKIIILKTKAFWIVIKNSPLPALALTVEHLLFSVPGRLADSVLRVIRFFWRHLSKYQVGMIE
jgi:hypothetical protein